MPVLEGLADCAAPLSVDTAKPEVMKAALAAGASMINDISALRVPGTLEAVAASDAGVCLMHMQASRAPCSKAPATATWSPRSLPSSGARRRGARRGIARERIVIDPGFGFGKTVAHNFDLLRNLDRVAALGLPVLAGWSRKSTLGAITGRAADHRLAASVAAALLAVERGARIVRVHDVAATRDALAVLAALQGNR